MTTAVAIAVVLLVLVVTNVWVHLGPGQVHVVTGPLAALLLLVLARMAGLTWQELGFGRPALMRGLQFAAVAAVAVAVVYAVAVSMPVTRGAFRDTRYRMGPGRALYTALVAIPLGTVLFEEVAFRSVLWGLLSRDYGILTATAVSAGLFGLWHMLPATALARTHTSVQGRSAEGEVGEGRSVHGRSAEGENAEGENAEGEDAEGDTAAGPRRLTITVLATIAFTTLAGIVFAELRRRSGSLVAPIGLHWATNGFGVLAATRVWAISAGETETPDASGPLGVVTQPAWKRIIRRLRSSRS
ncbi:MAG TPA: CPBP family intramembrane glutamic endopeptidase [Dermatophilaceae bacterium]